MHMCVPPFFFRIFHNVLLFFIFCREKNEHVSSGAGRSFCVLINSTLSSYGTCTHIIFQLNIHHLNFGRGKGHTVWVTQAIDHVLDHCFCRTLSSPTNSRFYLRHPCAELFSVVTSLPQCNQCDL